MIDPCHPGSIGDAAVIGGLTGFVTGGAAAGLSSGLSAGATTAESITNVATTAETAPATTAIETAPTTTAQDLSDSAVNQASTAGENGFASPPVQTGPPVNVIGNLPDTAAYTDLPGYEVVPSEGWDRAANDAWIQQGIREGRTFQVASDLTESNLYNGGTYNDGFRVYGVEIGQLLNAGYQFSGQFLVPPVP